VLVVVHGNSRNALDYYRYAVDAAKLAGSDSVIVAPQFLTAADSPPSGVLYWSEGGWKNGSKSQDSPRSRPFRISSFEVMDRLIVAIRHAFPNALVTLAGHSAGGQLTNLYAAAGDDGVDRFVPMNPGSYMYLNAQRLVDGAWAVPSGCSDYDEYKHGLSSLDAVGYVGALGPDTLRARYTTRDDRVALGDRDVDPNDPELDTSCAAEAQGAFRYERGLRFARHVAAFFPAARLTTLVVAGVAHEGRKMIAAPETRPALFA
jgi:pimeloyl-ACP methyl ester carboxylesterase